MTETNRKTAWMWLAGDALRGLSVDRTDRTLTWIWQAGCHCADEDAIVQSVQQFQKEGAPSLIGAFPQDIAAEVQAVLDESIGPSRRASST